MFLEIRGIKKSFGSGDSKVDVLKGLDLDIEKGEFCVLLGPSGSGKSTLLNIIGGIDSADEGSISIEGERLADMNEKKLSRYRRSHLGYIFQMYNLIPNLTVRENIEVGAYLSKKAGCRRASSYTGNLRTPAETSQPAFRWSAAAYSHRTCHCKKSGHPSL